MRNRKTKKKIFCVAAACTAIALACLVLIAVIPRGTSARYADSETYGGTVYDATSGEHDHSEWIDFNAEFGDATEVWINKSGSYYLSDDFSFTYSEDLYYPPFCIWADDGSRGIEVNLCLNGHVLSCDGATCINISEEAQISSSDGTVLNLYDCGGDMERHYYKLRDDGVSYTFFEIEEDGKYTKDAEGNMVAVSEGDAVGYVRGGLITGGGTSYFDDNIDSYGGGISVHNRGVLNMYGGTIAGNESLSSGGGVCVSGGEFNMYGGSITGNRSETNGDTAHNDGGGGVCVHPTFYTVNQNIFFRLYGGEIRNNYCVGHGGGVEVNCLSDGSKAVQSSVVFEMYGGTIAGNAAEYGGGVSVYGRAYSDNMSTDTSTSAFKMYGGSIRDNVAESGGGGVYMETEDVTFEMSGGFITDNVQTVAGEDGGAGGVDYEYDDTVRLSGTAYIYGNFCAGWKSDIGIADGHYITLSGALTEGALIGVTLYDHTQITSSVSSDYISESVGYFVSDDDNYGVWVNTSTSFLELYAKSS